jgi:hypothetical protein
MKTEHLPMQTLKRINFVAFVFLLAGVFAMARSSAAQTLAYDDKAGLPLRLGQQVIVEKQTQSWPAEQKETVARTPQTLTFLADYSRREFARVEDRLEYSFQFNLPATMEQLSTCLFLPLVAGTPVQVTHGHYSRVAVTETVVVGETEKSLGTVRFISVPTRGEVAGFAVDTDPGGSWQDSADFDKQVGQCRVEVTPTGLRLCLARSANRWGQGRIQAKLVFYPKAVAFETIHPFSISGYKQALQPLYFLDFTNRKRDKTPFSVGPETFDASRGYGWVQAAAGLKIIDRMKALLHGGFASGMQPATFRMVAPPGDYFLTVAVGDTQNAVGPMNIVLNGRPWLQNLQVARAAIENRHTVVQPTDGMVTLQLTGNPWVLNSVALQPLLLAHEDFQMRRSWWNHNIDWPQETVWPEPLPERKAPED